MSLWCTDALVLALAQVVAEALPQDRLSADVLVLALDVFDNLGHDKVHLSS